MVSVFELPKMTHVEWVLPISTLLLLLFTAFWYMTPIFVMCVRMYKRSGLLNIVFISVLFFAFWGASCFLSLILPKAVLIVMSVITAIFLVLSIRIPKKSIEDIYFYVIGNYGYGMPAIRITLTDKFTEKLLFQWPKLIFTTLSCGLLFVGWIFLVYKHYLP